MTGYHIVKPGAGAVDLERWHKRRQVWQWFYDSSNPGWKTWGGAKRALAKLREEHPGEFDCARVK